MGESLSELKKNVSGKETEGQKKSSAGEISGRAVPRMRIQKRRRPAHEISPSASVIRRMPRYFRYIRELLNHDILRLSSSELANYMDVTASQVRQDFNCFGGFGRQGYGYNVKYLYTQMSDILGVSRRYRAIIIGSGNLGCALMQSALFDTRGVKLCAAFDNNPAHCNCKLGDLTVYPIETLERYCTENRIDIAVLTVPDTAVDQIMPLLEKGGVRGIWNFSNVNLRPQHAGISVENVHIADSLMSLTYHMKQQEEQVRSDIGKKVLKTDEN